MVPQGGHVAWGARCAFLSPCVAAKMRQYIPQCSPWTSILRGLHGLIVTIQALQVKDLPMDLSNKASLVDTLKGAPDVTHLFFCAYRPTGDAAKDVDANFGMFRDLIEAAEGAGLKLQHVSFLSGTKWYGECLPASYSHTAERHEASSLWSLYLGTLGICISLQLSGLPTTNQTMHVMHVTMAL